MNHLALIWLKIKDRDLYHKKKLEEKDQKFLSKAIANQPVFPVIGKNTYSFKHSGNCGDIIYSLPTIYALSENAKAFLYLQLDQPMNYSAERSKHPLNGVMLNESIFNMLKPLLLAQTPLSICGIYNDQSIDYDLCIIRRSAFQTNSGHIARWYFLHFAVTADLSKPWLNVNPDKSFSDRIIIARSLGYHAPGIDYSFLKKYKKLMFVGVPEEFEEIKKSLPSIEYHPVSDFLELAQVIAGCRFFIGNQSFPFSLAEALKVKRALEVYYVCPNVIVEGEHAYDFCFQQQFERIVEKLDQVS